MCADIRDAANGVIKAIADRENTDTRLPPAMIVTVLLAYIAITIYYILELYRRYTSIPLAQLLTLTALFAIGTGLVIAIFYILMSRNNRHSDRESRLRKSLIGYADANNYVCGSDLSADIQRLKDLDAGIDEAEDSVFRYRKLLYILVPAVFGAVLIPISEMRPYAVQIVAACYAASVVIAILVSPGITTFPRLHEQRTMGFFEEFNGVAASLNLKTVPFERTVGYRSFGVFVILSVATLGLFVVVWGYFAFNDMNRHFDEQWYYEDAIFRSLRGFETDIKENNAERGKDYILDDHWV